MTTFKQRTWISSVWSRIDGRTVRRIFLVLFLILSVGVLSGCDDAQNDTPLTPEEATKSLTANCLPCYAFNMAWKAVEDLSNKVLNSTVSSCRMLLAISLALWTAWTFMHHFASVKEAQPAKFWTQIGTRYFMAAVAGAALASPGLLFWMFNMFVGSIFSAFMDYAVGALNAMPLIAGASDVSKFQCGSSTNVTAALSAQAFPSVMGDTLVCVSKYMHQNLIPNYALADRLTRASMLTGVYWTGRAIHLLTFLLIISFVFSLLEGVFRMGVSLALLPFYILVIVYPKTRSFAFKGWLLFLTSFMQFTMMAVFILLSSLVINAYLHWRMPFLFEGNHSASYLANKLEEGAPGMMTFLLIATYIFILSGKTNEFASYFVGGPSSTSFPKLLMQFIKFIIGMAKAFAAGGAAGIAKAAAKGAASAAAKGGK